MKDLQIFNNSEFGQVRTLEIEGKIYFVGKDIAKALGYKNTNDAINRHCKGVVKHEGLKINGIEVSLIPEGDLYRLIVNSKLPNAEKFEGWVFDEVLPTIRKTGEYKVTTKDKYIAEIDVAKAEMDLLEITSKVLNLNNSSKLAIATNIYENHNIPTNQLPTYTQSKGRIRPISDLLKKNYINMSAIAFNKKLLEKGILKECTRQSSKGKEKKFKMLVNTEWGENLVNPKSPKETQPMYYEDKFEELIKIIL